MKSPTMVAAAVLVFVMTVVGAARAEAPTPALTVTSTIAPDRASLRAGVLSYGTSGLVRLVLRSRGSSAKPGDAVVVGIQNEGQEPFTVRADDAWTAITKDGRSVPLVRRLMPTEKKLPATLVVEPQRSTTFLLGVPAAETSEIAAVALEAREIGKTITARDVYEPPRARLVAPPRSPPGPPVDALGQEEATVAIAVAADGTLESVTPLPDAAGRLPRAEILEPVRAAVKKWTFAPALLNGTPTRALFERTFAFSARRVIRRVFPLPAKDLEPRLERYLREAYPWVVAIGPTSAAAVSDASSSPGSPTGVRGFAAAALPWRKKGIRGADAWLLRLGEDSASRAWVAVTSLTLLVRESPRGSSCECYWWAAQEDGAQDFMDLLAARLDLTAVQAEVFAPQDGALIPSGLVEQDELGRWSRTAVRKLLGVSFATTLGKYKQKVARKGVLAALDPAAPPPTAAEFFPAPGSAGRPPEPFRVGDDVSEPILIRRVNPDYPPETKSARVQGRVVLEATISASGTVVDLEILQGIAGLNVATVDAVCCWRYKPALKNGQPVSVYYPVYLDRGLR